MDETTRRLLLTSPVAAGKATELLMRYKEIDHQDWKVAEEFLLGLDNKDTLEPLAKLPTGKCAS